MRGRSIVLVACAGLLSATGPAPAAAQESLGRVLNPEMPPLLPNLISFERVEGDRRTIHFLDIQSGRVFPLEGTPQEVDSSALVLPGIGNRGAQFRSFSGDLAWRPVWDDQRRWFAYAAGTGDGRLGLFLHYLDRSDAVGAGEPILIPTEGDVVTPRWSPDGRMLTYSANGRIYVISRADRLLEPGRSVPAGVSVEVQGPRGTALYPVFSPGGDRLAYSVQTTVGGQNWGVEVVEVDSNGQAEGSPVLMTPALTNSNELRPSWSHDGTHLAYFLDRDPGGGGAAQIDIGVLRLVENPQGGVARGEVLQGRSPRIADDVFPNEIRGPTWVQWNAGGGQVAPAIVYVADDDARGDPVMLASVDAWSDAQADYAVRLDDELDWATEQHSFVIVAPHRLTGAYQSRFAYVHQVRGGQSLGIQDVANPALASLQVGCRLGRPGCWVSLREREGTTGRPSNGSSKALSLLLPGAGQLAAGETAKGAVLAAVAAGAAVLALTSIPSVDVADVQRVSTAGGNNYYLPGDPAVAAFEDDEGTLLLAAGVFGAAWVISALDAFVLGSGDSGMGFEIGPSPTTWRTEGGSGWDLGFRISR